MQKVADDNARLKCFDAIGSVAPATGEKPPATPKVVREWSIEEKKSPIDDTPEIEALLQSEDGMGFIFHSLNKCLAL